MKQNLIIASIAITVLASCSTYQGRNELPSSSPRAVDIQKSLDQTVISEIDLENVSLDNALQAWRKASLNSHAQRFDFRYAISRPMTFSSQRIQQGVSPSVPPTAGAPAPAKITVRRKNITSARLLDEICGQSNMSWLILGRVIVVRPSATASGTQP